MVTCVASADYLYWMVESNPININGESTTWETAAIYQDSTKLTPVAWDDMSLNGFTWSELAGNYETSSFYIELYNSSNEAIAKSQAIPYSALANNISPNLGIKPPATMSFTATSATFNVPEPTSGLLFVIGGMLLGLKRKRQV